MVSVCTDRDAAYIYVLIGSSRSMGNNQYRRGNIFCTMHWLQRKPKHKFWKILATRLGEQMFWNAFGLAVLFVVDTDITLATSLTAPHDCPHMQNPWGKVGFSGRPRADYCLLASRVACQLSCFMFTTSVRLKLVYLCAAEVAQYQEKA